MDDSQVSRHSLDGTRLALQRGVYRFVVIAIAAALAGLSSARSASAQAEAATPWDGRRPLALEIGTGYNAPNGAVSFAVDFALFRYLSVSAGVGRGDGSAHYSGMARIRFPAGTTAGGAVVHGLGVGLSTGRHTTSLPKVCEGNSSGWFDSDCPAAPQKIWQPAHRVDVEYSIELPLRVPWLVGRVFAGVSKIINDDNYVCDYGYSPANKYQCKNGTASTGNFFPYLGVSLAASFGASPAWTSGPDDENE
jgi:hypothetical protein